jgi:transposase InsO family protein
MLPPQAAHSGYSVLLITSLRECHATEADASLAGQRVTRVLDDVIARRGSPKALRWTMAELNSRDFRSWWSTGRLRRITSSLEPMQKGHIESFNGRLRDECLSTNWFRNLFEARREIACSATIMLACAHTAVLPTSSRRNSHITGNALRPASHRYCSRNRPSRLP